MVDETLSSGHSTREALKVMDLATMANYKYLLRIIKYVLLTKNHKLLFAKTPFDDEPIIWEVMAFTDSDFAGDKDTRKSVTGFIIYFGLRYLLALAKSEKRRIILHQSRVLRHLRRCHRNTLHQEPFGIHGNRSGSTNYHSSRQYWSHLSFGQRLIHNED